MRTLSFELNGMEELLKVIREEVSETIIATISKTLLQQQAQLHQKLITRKEVKEILQVRSDATIKSMEKKKILNPVYLNESKIPRYSLQEVQQLKDRK